LLEISAFYLIIVYTKCPRNIANWCCVPFTGVISPRVWE